MMTVSYESLVSAVFFFGAGFILLVAIINRNLFASIFGVGLSDAKAVQLFANHIRLPVRKVAPLIKPEYSVTCEICKQTVKYSIADVVRAHPRLERGVIVERAMGGVTYRFFIRHYCLTEYREIPVRHDAHFEFRSQGPSRPV